ncbi:MAG TPA: isoamylase early set domain-containing protein [Gemmatimonadaceae bacterium]|jgi:hypothetical protein|nr:isoamylase early set domain-containing protein [Gemmatimonadaceae bacterium]
MYRDRQERSLDQEQGDEVIRHAAARLRVPLPIDSGFDARVMTAVRAEARVAKAGSGHRVVRGWWTGVALASVAALVLLAVRSQIGSFHTGTPNPSTRGLPTTGATASTITATQGRPGLQRVRFEFVTPEVGNVRRVTIVGSFNGWNTSVTPLRSLGRGRWATEVPLSPGRYTYQFVINGRQWVPDPGAPRDADSDFGTSNSVVTVAQGGMT